MNDRSKQATPGDTVNPRRDAGRAAAAPHRKGLILQAGRLPILGAAAAFEFSRKLRKRIKASKWPGATAVT
jgi:hypothetical protein